MSDLAGTVDVGLGGIHQRVRDEVCFALASTLAGRQRIVVRVQEVQLPLNSGVVLADLVEMFQGLVINKKSKENRKQKIKTPETLHRANDRSSLNFEGGAILSCGRLIRLRYVMDRTVPRCCSWSSVAESVSASASIELEWSRPVRRRVPRGKCKAGRLAKFREEIPHEAFHSYPM